MTNRVLVALKFNRLSVPQKVEKGRFIVTSMTGNEFFLNPNPTLAAVTTAVGRLELAAIKAKGGGKDETAAMYAAENDLNKLVANLSLYVEVTANNFPTQAEAVILSAGMDVKKPGTHVAKGFEVKNTEISGQVSMRTNYTSRSAYIWQYNPNPENDSTWVYAGVSIKGSFEVSNLISGKEYSFRVAVVTKAGQGGWSNEIKLVIL